MQRTPPRPPLRGPACRTDDTIDAPMDRTIAMQWLGLAGLANPATALPPFAHRDAMTDAMTHAVVD